MNPSIEPGCVIPVGVKLACDVSVGARTVFSGHNISVESKAKIEAACVIGDNVTVGRGALLRAGAVALQSIPPNAIAEGNPARVIGYADSNIGPRQMPTRTVDVTAFKDAEPPMVLALGPGTSSLHLMRRVSDARGVLTVGEFNGELPFQPERYFVVFDVPSEELRGEHAHRNCQQFLICLHGSCRVLLDDGRDRCEVTLDRPNLGVYMPPLIWGTQYRYANDAVLLVFASRKYEAEDYIRYYDDFMEEVSLE